MTAKRPRIAPALVASIVETAPTRVRKRLDADPRAADAWAWSCVDGVWAIEAGEEKVTLAPSADARLDDVSQIACTCLLSPRCFHLLACVSVLEFGESGDTTSELSNDKEASNSADEEPVAAVQQDLTPRIDITEAMRRVTIETLDVLERLLHVGCRASGVVLQSSILRLSHHARIDALVNLSAALIRIAEGLQRFRMHDDRADAALLQSDIVFAIRHASTIRDAKELDPLILGQTRRSFHPVGLKQLRGVIAEPIWSLSGYAGVCVHLRGDDGVLYQVSQSRPGTIEWVHQTYNGGIDLGGVTVTGRRLSRSRLDVQNLTASDDGRLGKGASTRWAVRDRSATDDGVGDGLREDASDPFFRPLRDQVEAVFAMQSVDASRRRGGWDIVSGEGIVLGPWGASLAVHCDELSRPIQLGIAIDDEQLHFRRNLERLAGCIGTRIRFYGRLRSEIAGRIDALTIVPLADDGPVEFRLPETWENRVHLGVDELQRQHIIDREDRPESSPAKFDADDRASNFISITPELDRRLGMLVLGGRTSLVRVGSPGHRRDRFRLSSRYQTTAAALIDAIAISAGGEVGEQRRGAERQKPSLVSVMLASTVYCEAARESSEREAWLRLFET